MANGIYFLTWTTYGTWLCGDPRGWVDKHRAGINDPNPNLQTYANTQRAEPPVVLDKNLASAVEVAIRQTCHHKQWPIHALNVRSNHIHVVVTAEGINPMRVIKWLKNYSSRTLNQLAAPRKHWWTTGGSTRFINSDASFLRAIDYVNNQ